MKIEIELTEKEADALAVLCRDMELSENRVFIQALRLLQLYQAGKVQIDHGPGKLP